MFAVQLGAEMARLAFSADVQQTVKTIDDETIDRHEAEALAAARRECRVLKQKLDQKGRELEHALGLRRKLGDSTRKVAELRALLNEREHELRELRQSDGSMGSDDFAGRSGVDALAVDEMRRELEQTRARAAAAEDGQRKAQARVASLTKALEDARRRSGRGWAATDRTNADPVPSTSPASWARAALKLDSPELEGRHALPEPEPETVAEPEPIVELLSKSGSEDMPPQLQELRRRLNAGELCEEEAMVRALLTHLCFVGHLHTE